jgi:aquaporin Z
VMGLSMAATAALLIYSRIGQRSGAHFNPAVTLTYYRLGKIRGADAIGYIVAQFLGALAGVALARLALGSAIAAPPVEYAITRPGAAGLAVAFCAEVAISFLLMCCVLYAANHHRLASRAGFVAASLVCLYITFEGPLSGMSMNPARSFGSAILAGDLRDLWIYFVAPPLGMLLAAEWMLRLLPKGAVLCAKLHHLNAQPCIFLCDFDPTRLLGAGKPS